MTPCEGGTNWRTVNPGDQLTRELLDAIISYQQKSRLPINPQGIQDLARIAQVGVATLPGQPADTKLDGVSGQPENQTNGFASGSSFGGPVFGGSSAGGPIIGVVSKKSGKMFRSYYGIEDYDHALFFPNVPVMAGGFISPFILQGLSVGAVPGAVPGGVPGAAPGITNQPMPTPPRK
jgi:hypothetical protein